jgi:opacity protein-like surface antigen
VVSSWSGAINSTNAYGVAWALMVGLSYQLTPSVLIDLGYRYLNDGPTRTFLNPQTGTTLKQSNVSQQVRIGVRYLIQ